MHVGTASIVRCCLTASNVQRPCLNPTFPLGQGLTPAVTLSREGPQTRTPCKLPRYLRYCFFAKGTWGVCEFSLVRRYVLACAIHTQAHRLSKITTPSQTTPHLLSRSTRLLLLCSSHTAAIVTQHQPSSNESGKPSVMPLPPSSPRRNRHSLPKSALQSVQRCQDEVYQQRPQANLAVTI